MNEAILQNGYYKQQIDEYQRCAMSMVTEKDAVASLMERLQKEPVDELAITDCFTRLPAWLDSLRARTTAEVCEGLVSACKRFLQEQKNHVRHFRECNEKKRTETIKSLEDFAAKVFPAAKTLGKKMPSLANISNEAREVCQSANQSAKQLLFTEAFDVLERSEPDAEVEPFLVSVFETPGAEQAALDGDLLDVSERAIGNMAVRIAEWAKSGQHDTECTGSKQQLLACAGKIHTMLGASGGENLRAALLALLEPHVELKSLVLDMGRNGESMMKEDLEKFYGTVTRLRSLQQQCSQQEEVIKLEEPGSGNFGKTFVVVLEKVSQASDAGEEFIKALANKVQTFVVEGVTSDIAKAEKSIGRRAQSGVSLWACKLAPDANFQAVVAEAQKSLLKAPYPDNVQASIAMLQEERCLNPPAAPSQD